MNSSIVVDYEKDESLHPSSLYNTRVCQKKKKNENDEKDVKGEKGRDTSNEEEVYDHNCKTSTGRYKLQNDYPVEQEFPFPSTIDNDFVFIPKRIMESEVGRRAYIYRYGDQQSCFDVDPKDEYSKNIYCSRPKPDIGGNDKKHDNDIFQNVSPFPVFPIPDRKRSILSIMFIIFILLSLIFVFTILEYQNEIEKI